MGGAQKCFLLPLLPLLSRNKHNVYLIGFFPGSNEVIFMMELVKILFHSELGKGKTINQVFLKKVAVTWGMTY